MNCPLCFQPMHAAAERCPHCSAESSQLNQLFQDYPDQIRLFNDQAGVLNVSHKKRVERWITRFNNEFPTCYLTIHLVSLNDDQSAKAYGIWALNQPIYSNAPEPSRSGAGICLTIDVQKKDVCLSYGYELEPHLSAEECFYMVAPAHPYLLDLDYFDSIKMIRHHLRKKMRWKSRIAKLTLKKKNIQLRNPS